MSRSLPFKSSRRACVVIGAEHEALLRSIGGNLCEYCSKRGSAGCAWEATATATVTRRAPEVPMAAAHAPARPRGRSVRHTAAEVASHLGP